MQPKIALFAILVLPEKNRSKAIKISSFRARYKFHHCLVNQQLNLLNKWFDNQFKLKTKLKLA